jgi:hypothetical protein
MKKTLLLVVAFAMAMVFQVNAQVRKCAADDLHKVKMANNPEYAKNQQNLERLTEKYIADVKAGRVSGGNVVIPCIVHVVYANSQENISTAQVQSQIDRLNDDFSATNSDYNQTPSIFTSVRSGDNGIRFELLETKRYSNSRSTWGTSDLVKSTYPPIEPARILNMWVADIGGGILGYAQFPNDTPATDGVVMSPQYFGDASKGSGFYLSAPFNLGRTATHEVGHWLNLRHIWGDGGCSQDDFVSDTPVAGQSNGGCPAANTNTCSGGESDMFMNYMDYVDDACMFMFSAGQKSRMNATFSNGGGREGFLLDPVYNPGGGSGGGGGSACTGGVSSFPYSESFESGTGAWSQGSGDNLNWTRRSGSTPSSTTGPSSASAGSNYMYVEASSPNYPSKVTYFESPCFDLSSATSATFTFKYHMYGANMGSLKLEASTNNGSSWTSVFTKSGDQGNSWKSGSVNLASYTGDAVKLRFVGTTGSGWRSDIAVDDVKLTTAGGGGGGGSTTSTLALTLVTDNYGSETAWTLKNSSGTTVASGSGYGNNQTINRSYTLPNGCYTFSITDEYGDGICCSYGNGSYTWKEGSTTKATGGSFGSGESKTICIGTSNREAGSAISLTSDFLIFPNPASDILNIRMESVEGTKVQVYNVSGQLVREAILSNSKPSINVAGLKQGVYILKAVNGESTFTKRFVKQ